VIRAAPVVVAVLSLVGCGSAGEGLDGPAWPTYDQRSDPLPWFLDGGCGGDGWCDDGEGAGPGPAPDGGSPGPSDLRVDSPAPDLCVSPTTCDVGFTYPKGGESAVQVTGDFYGPTWTKHAMTPSGAAWQTTLTLTRGKKVLYKFVLDGATWVPDPQNPEQEDDGFGGKNSVLDVDCPDPCNR
jgi:hypothetical protein